MTSRWEVRTLDQLDLSALLDVVSGDRAGVRISSYCSEAVANRLSNAILQDPGRANYEVRWAEKSSDRSEDGDRFERSDVERVGAVDTMPVDMGPTTSPLEAIVAARAVAAPELGPIDRLRLELDEVASGGAGLTRVDGQLRSAGIGRVMVRSDEVVHADVGRRGCLTANIYLRLPASGGATSIWRYDGDYLAAGRSYRFGDGEIPDDAPKVTVRPEVGDLVIWNPARPHVVHRFSGGPRVSLQVWLKLSSEESGSLTIRLLN